MKGDTSVFQLPRRKFYARQGEFAELRLEYAVVNAAATIK